MALRRPHLIRNLYWSIRIREFPYLFGSSRSYSDFNAKVSGLGYQSISSCSIEGRSTFPWVPGRATPLRSTMVAEVTIYLKESRMVTTQVKAPPGMQKKAGLQVSMLSPGFIYEPYAPREPISFWRRWFTRSGWKRMKEDIILELKSAYAINKLRKAGYDKKKFYQEAVQLYKEINTQIACGDKTSLRKAVTEKMYSAIKNEIKQRESRWNDFYWELIEPIVNIRTLRARLIGVDKNDLSKVFIQLTLEFLSKQKFEAYDSNGTIIAGDKSKEVVVPRKLLTHSICGNFLEDILGLIVTSKNESPKVLVRDIWVFEKSLFHKGAYWRLCGRISL